MLFPANHRFTKVKLWCSEHAGVGTGLWGGFVQRFPKTTRPDRTTNENNPRRSSVLLSGRCAVFQELNRFNLIRCEAVKDETAVPYHSLAFTGFLQSLGQL